MNRRKFLGIAGGAIAASGTTYYWLSDKRNLSRSDLKPVSVGNDVLQPDEREILLLASLAPSGHNTQPWLVEYLKPFHWIIGNDKSRWLPAVDPTQRETILSLGTFIQNLEFAAGSLGYQCHWNLLARTNQDERIIEVRLVKGSSTPAFDQQKIRQRRTIRSGYLRNDLKKEDLAFIADSETSGLHYFAATSKEGQFLAAQTIEANRLQTYRADAQNELADWIRFSSKVAEKHAGESRCSTLLSACFNPFPEDPAAEPCRCQ